jgi:hypothetical protein
MFDLTDNDLSGSILGCADGPASFNAEARRRGCQAISCDPLYQFAGDAIQSRIRVTYDRILHQLHQDQTGYIWKIFTSPEELGKARMSTMQRFLQDYTSGKQAGRYIAAGLPRLPFGNRLFDKVLCSHFLFLYSGQFSLDFHCASVLELCRVGREVRIFPLVEMSGVSSAYIKPVTSQLQQLGYRVEFKKVPYEFQRGADTMMQVFSGTI